MNLLFIRILCRKPTFHRKMIRWRKLQFLFLQSLQLFSLQKSITDEKMWDILLKIVWFIECFKIICQVFCTKKNLPFTLFEQEIMTKISFVFLFFHRLIKFVSCCESLKNEGKQKKSFNSFQDWETAKGFLWLYDGFDSTII